MPKLCCSLSKEVRDERGGRTAAVTLEVELSAETLKSPALLTKHIRCGFDRIRAAIEEELAGTDRVSAQGSTVERPEATTGRRNGGGDRRVTPNQLRLLNMLADRGDQDLAAVCRDRFGKGDVAELSTREASQLIDQLGGTADAKGRR